MLRFCEYNSANGYKKGDDTILFNKDIWEQGKRFLPYIVMRKVYL